MIDSLTNMGIDRGVKNSGRICVALLHFYHQMTRSYFFLFQIVKLIEYSGM